MRRLIMLLVVLALAITGAIVGPLVFSADANRAPAVARSGDLEWRNGTYSVRLTELPCHFYELADELAADDGIPPAKGAVVMLGARGVSACWMKDIGGDVMIKDMTGYTGMVPMEWFKRE